MAVHAPSAAHRRSYGVGPEPMPPTSTGSSARKRAPPALTSTWRTPSPVSSTVTCPLSLPARMARASRRPRRDDLRGVFGIRGARQQVIGVVERDEALGMAGRVEDRRRVL